jgi:hypothetical protein
MHCLSLKNSAKKIDRKTLSLQEMVMEDDFYDGQEVCLVT